MKNLLILIFLSSMALMLSGQQWTGMQKQGKSFYEIKQAMDIKFRGKTTRKGAPNYSKEMKHYKRWEFFWRSEVDENGNFPTARTLVNSYNEAISKEIKNSTKGGANWTYLGPTHLPNATMPDYPGMGRINAIAFHPTDTNIIWIGSPGGGLWKTTDGGNTWTSKGDNLPVMGISDIAIDPTNANVMYLVTGDADGQHNNSVGLLKSTDGGNSWNTTGLTFIVDSAFQASHILISPTNTSHILVSTSRGIFKSTDGATTFTKVYNSEADQLAFKYGSTTTVYASARPVKILKSTDFGSTWTVLPTTGLTGSKAEFGLTPANQNLIIAVGEDGGAAKSSNGGTSWSSFSIPANYSSQGGYNMFVQISNTNPDIMIVAGVLGWRTTNGGQSWEKYLNGYWNTNDPYFYVNPDQHVCKPAPWDTSLFFIGNDGGIFKGKLTQPNAWTNLTAGLHITQYYRMGSSSSNSNLLMAGAQDNDVVRFDGTSWHDVNNNSDGIDGMINYNNSSIAYAASQEGYLTKTTDNWQSETDITPKNAQYADFIWPIEMDPQNPDIIYGGYDEIFRSTNGGGNWTNITGGISSSVPFESISISPSNPSVIYAIDAYSNIYKTTNITSWSQLPSNSALINLASRICVSPSDPNIVYIILRGYLAYDKVYKSTDGGQTWTNISAGLPNVVMLSIVAQSGTNEDLYVGTSLGVYYKNKNSNWVPFNTGLPKVRVNDLEIHYGAGKLRAATYGRGIWQSDLATPVGIAGKQKEEQVFTVTPNPTTGLITINTKNIDLTDSKLVVYNIVGGIVKQVNPQSGSMTIDLSDLTKGVYFVSLITKNSTTTKRIILNN